MLQGLPRHKPTKHTTISCCAYKSGSSQTISTGGAGAAITFDAEEWDTDAIHDNASNNSRFTIPAGMDGKWRFTAATEFSSNATGDRAIWFRKNGTTTVRYAQQLRSAAGNATVVLATTTVILSAADYIEAMVYQDSGANRTLTNSAQATWCIAEYLGAT